MHPRATTAIALILLPIAATVGYLLACWIWPFSACHRCKGLGKHPSPGGRAFRYCRRCQGSGARLRIGRRIWNYLRRLHAEGR